MALVELTVAGPELRPAHHKVTIASTSTAITFDDIDSDGEFSDLAREWIVQTRPGRKALTQPGAPKLAKWTVTGRLAGRDPQQSIEATMLRFKSLANQGNPVALAYGQASSHVLMTSTGHWLIDDLTLHVVRRRQGTNDAVECEVRLQLLEANIPRWVRPASMATAPAANNVGSSTSSLLEGMVSADSPFGSIEGASKTYITKEGESLAQIAIRVYGTAGCWRRIADANKITDPRRTPAGTRLVLP